MSSEAVGTAARPIFVVGYMHSGTSLLQRIFEADPTVYASTGETKFFELLPAIEQRYPDLDRPDQRRAVAALARQTIRHGGSSILLAGKERFAVTPDAARAWADADLPSDAAEIFGVVFATLAERDGKARWLEKTPTHVFHLGRILRAFPDAQVVEVVRDPRSVLSSKKVRRRTAQSGTDSGRKLAKDFDPLLDSLSWRSAVRAGSDAAETRPESLLRVDYETLVRAPEATVGKICDFLGLAFDVDLLDVWGANTAYEPTRTRGITDAFVERWSDELTGGEVQAIEWVTGAEMRSAGYRSEPHSRRDQLGAARLAAASGLGLVVRIWHRYRMGGLPFATDVVRSYGGRARQLIPFGRPKAPGATPVRVTGERPPVVEPGPPRP